MGYVFQPQVRAVLGSRSSKSARLDVSSEGETIHLKITDYGHEQEYRWIVVDTKELGQCLDAARALI